MRRFAASAKDKIEQAVAPCDSSLIYLSNRIFQNLQPLGNKIHQGIKCLLDGSCFLAVGSLEVKRRFSTKDRHTPKISFTFWARVCLLIAFVEGIVFCKLLEIHDTLLIFYDLLFSVWRSVFIGILLIKRICIVILYLYLMFNLNLG